MSKEDLAFLTFLLKHHPSAKRLFANATESTGDDEAKYNFRVQDIQNGDMGFFIEKYAFVESADGPVQTGRTEFVHFPHKQAVKHFFPVTSQPRRQTWHSIQKRKRGRK